MTKPKGQQIREDLARKIRQGEYPPGAWLPSVEKLGRTYGVHSATVTRALQPLQDAGVLRGYKGSGIQVVRVPTDADVAMPEPSPQPKTTRQRLDEHEAAIAELRRKVEQLEQGAAD